MQYIYDRKIKYFFGIKKIARRHARNELMISQRVVIIFDEKGGKTVLLIYAPLYIKRGEKR